MEDFETPNDASGFLDKDGNFKTLAHMLTYAREMPKLPPGAPDPRTYLPEQEREFREDLQAWKNAYQIEQAMDRHRAKHERPEAPPPMSKHQSALFYGSSRDKIEARERLTLAREERELLARAAEHRSAGRVRKAKDLEELAASFNRDLTRRERTPYEFESTATDQSVKFSNEELNKWIKVSGKELQENIAQVTALVEGHRELSDDHHFYAFSGEGDSLQLNKVQSPGCPAKELHARAGLTDDNLILKYGVNGIETRDDPSTTESEPDELEPDEAAPAGNATALKESGIEVRPGMFGSGG